MVPAFTRLARVHVPLPPDAQDTVPVIVGKLPSSPTMAMHKALAGGENEAVVVVAVVPLTTAGVEASSAMATPQYPVASHAMQTHWAFTSS